MGILDGLKWFKNKLENNSKIIGLGTGLLNTAWNIGSGIFNYRMQNEMNELAMSREDNAIARRVADLKASGMSPILAAGSPAGASPVKISNLPEVSNSLSDNLLSIAQLEQQERIKQIELNIAMQNANSNIQYQRQLENESQAREDEIRNNIDWRNKLNQVNYDLNLEALDFARKINPLTLESKKLDNTLKEKEKIEKDYNIIIGANRALASSYEPILSKLRVSISEANVSNLKKDELLKNAELLAKEMAIKIAFEDWKAKQYSNYATYVTGNYKNIVDGKFTLGMWLGFNKDPDYKSFISSIQSGRSY